MVIQTLSVVVPAGCPNKCRFCVSQLHDDDYYYNQIEKNKKFKDLYRNDFIKRMSFARDNGCNTMIFTGRGEPIMNLPFIKNVSEWNNNLTKPFRWIEIQTSGVSINEERLKWLRNIVGISTISLSLSSIWDSSENSEYNQTPLKFKFDIENLCKKIKICDFNLRLSLNMTDFYNNKTPHEIFKRVKHLNADQVTFRILYKADDTPNKEQKKINSWITRHKTNKKIINEIYNYIKKYGTELEILPFGAIRYDIDGISTVVDDDCMNVTAKNSLKFLILRPNCKLYTKWDKKGSLLF